MNTEKTLELQYLMDEWTEPVFESLNSSDYLEYRKRKEALTMYACGIPFKQIKDDTGYSQSQIYRMINRCTSKDINNNYVGYYGLVTRYRIKKYYKTKSIAAIMDKHPELKSEIIRMYFSRKSGPAITPTKIYLFNYFQDRLSELGYSDNDYPKNLSDGGKRIFYYWIDQQEVENNLQLKRKSTEAKIHHQSTGVGDVARRPRRPYELVEIDGHRLDIIYSIPTINESGNTVLIPASRPWLLAAIDVYSRCIIGYHLCFRDEYNQQDIIRLINNMIKPHDTLEGVRRDGFPSCVFDECTYAIPNVIALDNAMSHLSNAVQDLATTLGIHLEYGPVNSPDRRPFIERFFGSLESKWLHLTPSTTGSNPSDIKRLNPEIDASKYGITRDIVIKLIEMSISDYNNTFHSSINHTPMEYLDSAIKDGIYPCRLPTNTRSKFNLSIRRRATIRGNSSTGRRPYIQVFNHRYAFDIESTSYSMVNMPVIIEFDPDDIRLLRVFDSIDDVDAHKFDRSKHHLPKGQFIGVARMTGYDADRPLSLENYMAVNKHKNKSKTNNNGSDETTKYIESLKEKTDKKSLKELENIASTLGENYIPNFKNTNETFEKPNVQSMSINEAINEITKANINEQHNKNIEFINSISSIEELKELLWK